MCVCIEVDRLYDVWDDACNGCSKLTLLASASVCALVHCAQTTDSKVNECDCHSAIFGVYENVN